MKNKINLSSSLEDYLEACFNLQTKVGKIRITDLSLELGVEKPSANFAINKLKNLKLINHERYEEITLTPLGLSEAKLIKNRHDILFDFLHNLLGISKIEAQADACRIEHSVSANTIKKMKTFITYFSENPAFSKEDFLNFYNNETES